MIIIDLSQITPPMLWSGGVVNGILSLTVATSDHALVQKCGSEAMWSRTASSGMVAMPTGPNGFDPTAMLVVKSELAFHSHARRLNEPAFDDVSSHTNGCRERLVDWIADFASSFGVGLRPRLQRVPWNPG